MGKLYISKQWALLLLSLVLILSGCSTPERAGRVIPKLDRPDTPMVEPTLSSTNRNSWSQGQPAKAKLTLSISGLAAKHFVPPFRSEDRTAFKRALSTALRGDLKRTMSGELNLERLAAEFNRVILRYERALMQAIESIEQNSNPTDRNTESVDYEMLVQNWIRVGGTQERAATFEVWAQSVIHGYRLDIQLSAESVAELNLRTEIDNYLW